MNRKMTRLAAIVAGFATLGVFTVSTPAQADPEEWQCIEEGAKAAPMGAATGAAVGSAAGGIGAVPGAAQGAALSSAGAMGNCTINKNTDEMRNAADEAADVANDAADEAANVANDAKQEVEKHLPF
ncbi:MAG: hypothetical protein ABEI32_14010 [Halothece sp.]|jgi:hypothetical protein